MEVSVNTHDMFKKEGHSYKNVFKYAKAEKRKLNKEVFHCIKNQNDFIWELALHRDKIFRTHLGEGL